MNWTDLKITVSTKDAETAEAIAQMAVPYGIYIEDYSDMLELVPQIAHIDLIDEDLLARSRTEAILHLYLPPEENPAEASAFLTHRLEAEGIPYRIETDQTLAEEDWANAWKRFYHPTHLGKRLVVCPSWEEYTPTPEELVMIPAWPLAAAPTTPPACAASCWSSSPLNIHAYWIWEPAAAFFPLPH